VQDATVACLSTAMNCESSASLLAETLWWSDSGKKFCANRTENGSVGAPQNPSQHIITITYFGKIKINDTLKIANKKAVFSRRFGNTAFMLAGREHRNGWLQRCAARTSSQHDVDQLVWHDNDLAG